MTIHIDADLVNADWPKRTDDTGHAWGALVDPPALVASNPWHDELGKFAPKGAVGTAGGFKPGDELSGQTVVQQNLMGEDVDVPVEFMRKEGDYEYVDWQAWSDHEAVLVERVRAPIRDGNAPLTPDQQRSLTTYQSAFGVHQEINGALRGTRPSNAVMDDHIANIDAAIAASSLPSDTDLFRGIQFTNVKEQRAFVGQLVVGSTYHDKAFASTSLSESTASQFTAYGEKPSVIMTIRAPAGTNYRYFNGGEDEVLLPRNTGLRVVTLSTEGRTARVEMEVVAT